MHDGGAAAKCDVFVFTDCVLFFRTNHSAVADERRYRYRAGDQIFLLLREDVGLVEEQGE